MGEGGKPSLLFLDFLLLHHIMDAIQGSNLCRIIVLTNHVSTKMSRVSDFTWLGWLKANYKLRNKTTESFNIDLLVCFAIRNEIFIGTKLNKGLWACVPHSLLYCTNIVIFINHIRVFKFPQQWPRQQMLNNLLRDFEIKFSCNIIITNLWQVWLLQRYTQRNWSTLWG